MKNIIFIFLLEENKKEDERERMLIAFVAT